MPPTFATQSELIKGPSATFADQSDVIADESNEANEPAEESETPFLGFLNRGIASALGSPVDLVSAGLNLLGAPVSEQPVGGSKSIEALMGVSGVGLPEPGVSPQTLGERVQRGVGETVGALVPVAGVATTVARGAGMAANVSRSLVEGAARAPIATTGADVASGALSGVGSQVAAENFPDNDVAEALGALAGGLTPALAGPLVRGVPKLVPGAGIAARAVKGVVAPFTKPGATVRAERRAQSLVADPDAAAKGLETDDFIADLSPAQRTGERRLLALEREVLARDVNLESEFGQRTAEAQDVLRAQLGEIGAGDVAATKGFIEARRERLNDATSLRATQAAAEAERRIKAVMPERRASESSVIVRDEIEKALSSARAQENKLWESVPDDISVSTLNVKNTFRAFRDDLPRAQREDIPEVANRFLGLGNEEFDSVETVKEMQGLLSKLREDSRMARAASEFNRARISDGIADSLVDDLSAVEGAGAAFEVARNFSRGLNEKFSRGAVGRVLGRARAGGPTVAPELTLQSTIGAGGDRGSVAAQQILNAAPGAETEIGQFVMDRFKRAAFRGDELNPDAARDFVRGTNMLDNFPDLRQSMLDAARAQERSAGAVARVQTSKRSVNRSQAKEFLGARPGEEISRIIRSKDPAAAARQIRLQVRKDKTGKALDGLKTSAIDHLIKQAETGSVNDFGQRMLSGRALKAALKDKATKAALSEILSSVELGRVRRIADELALIEVAAGRLPDIGGDVVADVPSSVLDMVFRVLGAQQGRVVAGAMGGGTVQTPGIFSGRARQLLNNLTNDTAKELLVDAVKDPELLRALLVPASKLGTSKVLARRLNAWLAGPGLRFAEALEDEPAP